jgi:hypothetical protein
LFRPALPEDAQAVLQVYAIAARAVCARPQTLSAIDHWLNSLHSRLVPPESGAAEACHALWQLFARVAQVPKERLRLEAAQAFYHDLDRLGQRLDLPPLDDWQDIPSGVDAPDAAWEGEALTPEPVSLAAVRERACDVVRRHGGALKRFPAADAARLLAVLGPEQRRELFDSLVAQGEMGRADVNLLIRFLVKGGEVTPADTALSEVLERLGSWLAASEPSVG